LPALRVLVCVCSGCVFLTGCFSLSTGGSGDSNVFSLSTNEMQFSSADQELSFAISFGSSVTSRDWEIRGAPSWLELSATQGTDSAVVVVQANRAALEPGNYQATLLVISGRQSEFITVTMTVI